MRFSIASGFLPSLLAVGCYGSALAPRATGDLCVFTEGRAVLLDNLVFMMGGKWTFHNSDNEAFENKLYWIDLNTTFGVEGGIPPNTLKSIDGPNNAPHKKGGALFAAHDTVYIYAGLGSSKRYDWMWSYSATEGTWSHAEVDGGMLNVEERFAGLTTRAPESNLSFFTGGWDRPITGTLVFNATDDNNPRWTNVTQVIGDDAVEAPRMANGGMEYVRMGKSGVLVAFGGYDFEKKATNNTKYGTETGVDLRPMDKISVFDIESSTWYEIEATGDIPKPRTAFCTGVSSAPDDSSFQLHMYGGRHRKIKNATVYDDVYVLSLPSFRWIHAPTTGLQSKEDGVGRESHKCVTWKDGEMVVLGGTFRVGDTVKKGCSKDYPPIRVLNTSKFKWEEQFSRDTSYSVPGIVSDIIGGDKTGKATLNEPEDGWPNDKVGTIFSQRVARLPEPSETPLPSEPTGTSQPTATPPPKKSNSGAIAGGVVGALAGIGIIAGIIFFLLRKQKKQQKHDRSFNVTPAVPTAPGLYSSSPSEPNYKQASDAKDYHPLNPMQPRELPAAYAPLVPRSELESPGDSKHILMRQELESPVDSKQFPMRSELASPVDAKRASIRYELESPGDYPPPRSPKSPL
ncbi:hypothetical protein FQN55_002457 [Onygenales sp. PD_40]|nr:hypothetical protein FQN55_002457 [Onygenales sp. PD_40]KAK2758448.1 hypothetical protein FQN53_008246 [Emmonsiellopsis sp. PD_33]